MTRKRLRIFLPSWSALYIAIIAIIVSFIIPVSEAQFFDAFTADKRFFTGSKGNSGGGGGIFGSLGGFGGSSDGNSGYGAPKPSYGTPTPRPKPSYGAQKPSYNGGGGLGGGLNFKNIQLPVPDIPLPDPIEFKAGVLRSKGRIASGLLHAKAGILRAGANILAQKANALDKVAQAIPAVKAGLINTLQNFGGDKGNFGLGGNNNNGYGAPQQPSYGAPAQSYQSQQQNSGYGAPQAPQIRPSYNPVNAIPTNNGNNINVGSSLNFGNNQQQQQQYGNNQFSNNNQVPNNNQQQQNNNLFFNNNQQQAPDSYGSPVGNPIGPSNNQNNNQLLFNNNNNQISAPQQAYTSLNNNNQFQPSNLIAPQNNQNNQVITQQQQLSQLLSNNNAGLNSNVDPNPVNFNFIGGNDIASSNQVNPFLSNPEKLLLQESRQQQTGNLNSGQCTSDTALQSLLEDLFMGHEIIPDIVDKPPQFPLELTYKTVRTFPGMKLTADMTRFKPMLHWPAKNNALYTVILSNLDINNRRNRTLSEFWHWFVANVPGDSVDAGEVIFEHLFPLVLPEGNGNHRFGYFVFEQPGALDYSDEGGPTDACSPNMSNGRGPFKSTKNFQKKYGLTLTAATFVIIDYSEASMEIACEWQKCIGDTINLVSPLKCGADDDGKKKKKKKK